jgi:hypothetical protein
MKKNRPLAIFLVLCFALAACNSAPAATSTPMPTETPIPPTPTATPDPLLLVDLRNPATYPAWMDYFTRDEWPPVEEQHDISANLSRLYRLLLENRGIEGVETMNDGQVFFMAGQIANREGWNIPANLDAVRDWFAGPQGAAHSSLDGSYQYGIFRILQFSDKSIGLQHAYTPGEITTNTFGENVLLQRLMPYFGIAATEGILVDLTAGRSAIIFHYMNEGQDYYMPLAVNFEDIHSTETIRAPDYVYRVWRWDKDIPPCLATPYNQGRWTEDDLRTQMADAKRIFAETFTAAGDPIVYGLELAWYISVDPKP